jgi:hypothetical protein
MVHLTARAAERLSGSSQSVMARELQLWCSGTSCNQTEYAMYDAEEFIKGRETSTRITCPKCAVKFDELMQAEEWVE